MVVQSEALARVARTAQSSLGFRLNHSAEAVVGIVTCRAAKILVLQRGIEAARLEDVLNAEAGVSRPALERCGWIDPADRMVIGQIEP
jgi:hypothetical protein